MSKLNTFVINANFDNTVILIVSSVIISDVIRCKDSLPEITKEYFRITRFLNHINMLTFDSAYDSMIARLVDEITNDIDKEVVDSLVKLAKESPV